MDGYDLGRHGLGAVTLAIAAVLYIASCGTAQAAPHTVRYRNPDATRTYTQLRTTWGTVPVSCAPGATCSAVFDIPFGQRAIKAQAAVGTAWSGDSNTITKLVQPTPVECLAIPACRFDANSDGSVTLLDFNGFSSVFGGTWIP